MAPTAGGADENQTQLYQHQQQQGRKELWRQALESSSKGEFFLVSLLEVVIEDEQEQQNIARKKKELDLLVQDEMVMIPYRPSDYSEACRAFIDDPIYKVMSVLLIISAGVLGAVEAEQEKESLMVTILDFFLVAWFCVECNIHIASEGEHPQCYFFGRDTEVWTTAAKWNVFDFTVSYLSLVLATVITETADGSHRVVVLFRLLRLLRLATILNKTPELAVIVTGFFTALNSVVFIFFILFLFVYIYSVLGYYLFHLNDPVRFGSVSMSMITLLQVATLSQWDQVLYTQQLGCEAYPGSLYINRTVVVNPLYFNTTDDVYDDDGNTIHTAAGIFRPISCDPHPQPVTAAVYFISFTTLCAFVILNLFIGFTTLSMLRQMESHMRSKRRNLQALHFRDHLYASLEYALDSKDALYERLKKSSLGLTSENIIKQPSNRAEAEKNLSQPDTDSSKLSTKSLLRTTSSKKKTALPKNVINIDVFVEEEKDTALLLKRKKEKKHHGFSFSFSSFRMKDIEEEEDEDGGLESHDEEAARHHNDEIALLLEEKQRCEVEEKDEMADDDAIHLAGIYIEVANKAEDEEEIDGENVTDMDVHELSRIKRKQQMYHKKRKWVGDDLILATIDHLKNDPDFRLLEKEVTEDSPWFEQKLKSLGIKSFYRWAAKRCNGMIIDPRFDYFITVAVFLAVVMVVIESIKNQKNEPRINAYALAPINLTVLLIFVVEVVIKVVAEYLAPLAYLNNGWNRFDLFIVILSLYGLITGGASVNMFRVVRFLQVVKLTKKLKNLKVLVEALFAGFESMGYIMVLIIVFNFILGIAGINYFKYNDFLNFGNLRAGMLTIFRVETLQAWEELLYVNMFGCNQYFTPAFANFQEYSCRESSAGGYGAFFFFSFVVVFGAWIMPTLLIGVITAAVKESNFDVAEFAEVDDRVHSVLNNYQEVFTERLIKTCEFTFRFCDKDGSGSLTLSETLDAMRLLGFGSGFNDLAFQTFLCVDRDGSGAVDRAEFFEMIGKIQIVFSVLESKSLTYGGMKPAEFAQASAEFQTMAIFNSTARGSGTAGSVENGMLHLSDLGKVNPGTANSKELKEDSKEGGEEDAIIRTEEVDKKTEKKLDESGIFPNWDALAELCDCVLDAARHDELRRGLLKSELVNHAAHALYRLCFSPLLNVPMIRAMEDFEPCSRFMGSVPGFYFGTVDFGTGYYLDPQSDKVLGQGQREHLIKQRVQCARLIRGRSLWDFLDNLHLEKHLTQQREMKMKEQAKINKIKHERYLQDEKEKEKKLKEKKLKEQEEERILVLKQKKEEEEKKEKLKLVNLLPEESEAVRLEKEKQMDEERFRKAKNKKHTKFSLIVDDDAGDVVESDTSNHSIVSLQNEIAKVRGEKMTYFEVPMVVNNEDESNRSFNLEQHTHKQISHLLLRSLSRRKETPLYPFGVVTSANDEKNQRFVEKTVKDNESKLLCYHESLLKIISRDSRTMYYHLKELDRLFRKFNLVNKHLEHKQNLDHIFTEDKALTYAHAPLPSTVPSLLERHGSLTSRPSIRSVDSLKQPVEASSKFNVGNNQDSLALITPSSSTNGWQILLEEAKPECQIDYQDHPNMRQRRIVTLHRAVRWREFSEISDVINEDPELLMEHDKRTGNTALHIATQNDDYEMLELVLRRYGSKEKFGAEITDARSGDKVIELDVNVQNHHGNTPLHMAVEFGHEKCREFLLHHGAVETITNYKNFPANSGISGNFGRVIKKFAKPTSETGTKI